MITTADARYIISEIRNIPHYSDRIKKMQEQVERLQVMIDTATSPVSPNGGSDVLIKGVWVRVKVPSSHSVDSASRINAYISAQQEYEAKIRDLRKRLAIAVAMKKKVLEQDEQDRAFVNDFFAQKLTYRELQIAHNISNPYDKIIRIIKNSDIRV